MRKWNLLFIVIIVVQNFNIECEGKLKGGVKIDNQILDVYYYTVSKTDLEKWKEFFNGKFIYN